VNAELFLLAFAAALKPKLLALDLLLIKNHRPRAMSGCILASGLGVAIAIPAELPMIVSWGRHNYRYGSTYAALLAVCRCGAFVALQCVGCRCIARLHSRLRHANLVKKVVRLARSGT
jgi:hypothetical protein